MLALSGIETMKEERRKNLRVYFDKLSASLARLAVKRIYAYPSS